ncbi:MAG: glycosyltransferase family 1 protein [Myxococcales bacterium FL481]|nr:MAG: glycosyltransferase family 1 protein [Myxococcales bacterium FL481]
MARIVESFQPSLTPLAVRAAPRRPGTEGPWTPGAVASVVAAIELGARLRAVDPERVEHVLLVGASHPALLAGIVAACPGVSCVVVCDDETQLRRFADDGSGLSSPRMVDAFSLGLRPDDGELALVPAVCAGLAQRPAALRHSLVVVDPMRSADAPKLAEWADLLQRLVDPLCPVAADPVLASYQLDRGPASHDALLRFADRLGVCGDTFRAVQLLTGFREQGASGIRASRLAALWSQLAVFRRAIGGLARAGLPPERTEAAIVELETLAGHARAQQDAFARRNLAHLGEHFPELTTQLERTPAADLDAARVDHSAWIYDCTVQRAYLAEYPLLIDAAEDRVTSLNRPTDPRRFHEFYRGLRDPRAAHACVGTVTAVASIVALQRNRVRTSMVNWQQMLYLCEPDLRLFRRMIELFDFSPYLGREQIRLYVGPTAYRRFCLGFAEHIKRIIPPLREHLPAPVEVALERVAQSRRHRAERAKYALWQEYSPSRHAALLAKLNAGEPLRVWGLTSRHTTVLQYVVGDLLDGFAALGHHTELVMEQDSGEKVHTYATLDSLARARPDVVLLADHLRPELGDALPPHIPALVWVLDEMPDLNDPAIIAKLGPLDLTFPISEEWTQRYLSLGYPHAECLPFAANPARCQVDEAIEPADAVAFATHVVHPTEFGWAPGFLARLAESLERTELPAWDLDAQRELIDATIDSLGPTFSLSQRERLHFQGFLLSRDRDRISIASALLDAGVPLSLYGRGWDRVERFVPHARGVVQPGPELGRLYRSHKVVLHINQTCNLHVRVLEALSVGAFVLARAAGPLDAAPGGAATALEIGRELCLFTDAVDMVAKIRRAFTDEAWRSDMARRGRDRVMRDHTYRARAATMIEALHGRLRDVAHDQLAV